ncbi:MAG: hypothetical protein U0Y68_26640 [Blastocatellia bacterium]
MSASTGKRSSSREWIIALSVFVVFCGMCGFLGVFRDQFGRSKSFFSSSESSSSSSSKHVAATPSGKVYTAAPQKAAAAKQHDDTAAAGPQVNITRARLVPVVNPQGKSAQQVLIDWENVGAVPVTAVYARLDFYDDKDRLLPAARLDSQRIFAATPGGEPIAPNAAYQMPKGEGIALAPAASGAQRVAVEIVRIETP